MYLLASYYLIILPLPQTTDIRSLQREGTQYYQLMPFNFIVIMCLIGVIMNKFKKIKLSDDLYYSIKQERTKK